MKVGWLKLKDTWYYFNLDGIMVTNQHVIDGKDYLFDSSGKLIEHSGWFKVEEQRYYSTWVYSNGDGTVIKDQWFQLGNDWYYSDIFGNSIRNSTYGIDEKQYLFDETGKLVVDRWYQFRTNAYNEDLVYYHEWQYGDSEGVTPHNVWKTINGKDYYFDEYEVAQSRAFKINEQNFLFDSNFTIVTGDGWRQIDSVWYYLENGCLLLIHGNLLVANGTTLVTHP